MNVEDISVTMLQQLADRKSGNEPFARMKAIAQSMTPQWQADMGGSLKSVETSNASAKSKIPGFYALLERANDMRKDHVACKKGCDACCHMQVEISEVEAARIAFHVERDYVRLKPGRNTTPINALGRKSTPCTFLKDSQCSIYEVRPFVCREMAVVDVDALTCSFENMALARAGDPRFVGVPQAKVGPVSDAFARMVIRPNATLGDIRQFFPNSQPVAA